MPAPQRFIGETGRELNREKLSGKQGTQPSDRETTNNP
jgi:hypothetical protein